MPKTKLALGQHNSTGSGGYHFRRQQVIDCVIVDFYCLDRAGGGDSWQRQLGTRSCS
jgi:hypothetical protein